MQPFRYRLSAALVLGLAGLAGCGSSNAGPASSGTGTPAGKAVTLLNVSYDPTREFYNEFNAAFIAHRKAENGEIVTIEQSHGGSGKQARAVIDGLEADVVTLALSQDIDAIAEGSKLLPADWQKRLGNNSSPYTSTIVFLVRKGNPKGIKDWGDLVKGDVSIITPNPKTSGGARWNYLAAWGYALKQNLGDPGQLKTADPAKLAAANAHAKSFVEQLFARVPVLDSGARGSTNTFVQRGLGDVLLAWENEAYLALKDPATAKGLEIVVPSFSILAEPPVALIDKNAAKKGTTATAQAYLDYLYTPEGQTLAAKHFYRPSAPDKVKAGTGPEFAKLELITIADFGGWTKAQAEHFADGGTFDLIYKPSAK